MNKIRLFLPVIVFLSYSCSSGSSNSSGSGESTLTTNDLNSLIQTVSDSCTTEQCKPGVYLIKDATSLTRMGMTLESQQQQTAQFSNNHYAILVAPGTYNMVDDANNPRAFNLGYYTQVLGVAKSMEDVIINPGIEAYNQGGFMQGAPDCFSDQSNPLCLTLGGLNNFWRGVENFTIQNNRSSGGNSQILIFAVSQASPIRSIHFKGSNVLLCDYHTPSWGCGYTSGGFMANSVVDQTLIPGSQQQWISRNSQYGPVPDSNNSPEVAAWNSVFVGTTFVNDPVQKSPFPFVYNQESNNPWNNFPVANVKEAAISKEKPYLSCGSTCTESGDNIIWKVEVPQLRVNSSGIDTELPTELDVTAKFGIVSPNSGTTSESGVTTLDTNAINQINQDLASGKNLLITPGVYNLDGGTINITNNDTVVLGLGLPSLVCTSGQSCLNISATAGVDLAGFTLDAGYKLTPNLLQIGSAANKTGSPTDPIFLHDVFFRIAETQLSQRVPGEERQTTATAVIYTSYTVGDNLWIWRADHDKPSTVSMTNAESNLVNWTQDRAKYGLIVYGNNVTINGLAVEHFQDYQTIWYGENGTVNFYQSEMPYDVPSLNQWTCNDPKTATVSTGNGCASYVVDKDVKSHTANGLGVYSYFAFNPIMARSALLLPADVNINYLIGKWLNGNQLSGYKNLATSYDAKCWGYGVNYTPNDNGQSQYSVLGGINNSVATNSCN